MPNLAQLSVERFRNIRQRQRINEKLGDMERDLEDAGLPYVRLRLANWQDAEFQPKNKPLLFTRIRGSPKSLESDSMFLATYAEVRTSIERINISDDLKTAVAAVAAEAVVPESKTANSILPALEEHRKEIRRIRQSVAHEKLKVSTVLRFASRVRSDIPVSRSTTEFIHTLEDYERIAEKAVQKDEFVNVLKSWGNVDLDSLGMYSVLMALVLRYPGRNLSDYHKMRLEVTHEAREAAATWEELSSLVDRNFVITDRGGKRYWPHEAFIRKHYKVKPPKRVTLTDWMPQKTVR
jgi:hypothetical protein